MQFIQSATPWQVTGWKGLVVNDANGNTLCLYPSDQPYCPPERSHELAILIAAAPAFQEAWALVPDNVKANVFASLRQAGMEWVQKQIG